MSGYVPVFDTVFQGTLCGRWPDSGVWLCLLALADKHGNIDMAVPYIAAVTGIPADVLTDCINRFMQPDPNSRTKTEDGRRLLLLDPNRPWGWKIVNHGLYREKARKQAYDSERTASGKDAARKKVSRDVPTRPDASRDVPLSDSDSDTNKDNAREALVAGLDMKAWGRWLAYRVSIRKPIKPQSMEAAQRKLAGFGTSQSAVVENSIAEGYTGLFPGKNLPAKPVKDPFKGALRES